MTDLLTEPLPPQKPLQKYAQMETDCFCEHCGYNLHGQPVHRDEQLGIMVCRCPECGRFHAAGYRTIAMSIWMSRLATALLTFWIILEVTVVVLALISFGAIGITHAQLNLETVPVDKSGREIEYRQVGITGTFQAVYKDTGQVTTNPVSYQARVAVRHYQSWQEAWGPSLVMTFFSWLCGFVLAILAVTFVWHWPRGRYLYLLLLPLLAVGFTIPSFALDFGVQIRGWLAQRMLYEAAVQMVGLVMGIVMGRPLVRLILRMFVPPRPRQLFNFLWRVDGKIAPAPPTT